jgi:membrane protein
MRSGAPHEIPPEISPWKLGGLTVVELGRRVWNSIDEDDVFGRAAQLAYYFFLSIFPGLIFVMSIFGILASAGSEMRSGLLQYMQTAMPPMAFQLVNKVVTETTQASGTGKLTFGLVFALWSAAYAMSALQDTLNAVHNVKEGRPFWKRNGIALGLTVVCSLLLVVAMAIILYGGNVVNLVAGHVGLGPVITIAWKCVQWGIAFFFLVLVFALIYYWAPDVEQRRWEWLTPGSVIGIITWLIASIGLRIYLHFFNSYSATYGVLGAAIILLTWFYVSGMVLLMGAEVNAEIENAAAKRGAPDAKPKGHKTPANVSNEPAA